MRRLEVNYWLLSFWDIHLLASSPLMKIKLFAPKPKNVSNNVSSGWRIFRKRKFERLYKDLWNPGGTQKPLQLYWYPIFSWIFFMNLFFYAYKTWGHDPIWYFSCLCEWTQSFAFSELYSNQTKSEIYPKMPMFEQLKKQVPVNSKHFLTPQ